MNIIRIKIIGSWLLLVLFSLLMCFSWRYRFLWVALFPAAIVSLELIKPRRSGTMPPGIKTLLWLILFLFVFAVVVHGFMFPQSASLYLAVKILFALLSFPLLCYKIYLDYVTFSSSGGGSA